MSSIIFGIEIANEILARLKKLPRQKKFLAAILVGDNSASQSFLRQKQKIAEKVGVGFTLYKLPENTTSEELKNAILQFANNSECGGIILQLPIPKHLNAQIALDAIPPEKDIDVLGVRAIHAFQNGTSIVLPPSVGVVQEILSRVKCQLSFVSVAVIGVGPLVGGPIAAWLNGKAKEVIVLRRGSDFSSIKNADVVICGAGTPGLVTSDMLKKDALVIDFGYGTKNGRLVGDFDASQLSDASGQVWNGAYTPTPAGTGPILVAKLFENFYELNK